MVAQQDEEHHKMLRRPFAKIYSAHSLENVECLAVEPIQLFLGRMREHAVAGDTLDLGFWLQLCVWDILCSIMFSKRFGFLDQGADVDNLLALIWKQFQDGAPVSAALLAEA